MERRLALLLLLCSHVERATGFGGLTALNSNNFHLETPTGDTTFFPIAAGEAPEDSYKNMPVGIAEWQQLAPP